MLFTGRIGEAEECLVPLQADLHAEYGPDDPATRDAVNLLDRIGRTGT